MTEETEVPQKAETATPAAAVLATVEAVVRELRPGLGAVSVELGSSLDRDLGIDSLGRAELVARIEQEFDIALPERVFASAETPRDLVDAVAAASAAGAKRPPTMARAKGAVVAPTPTPTTVEPVPLGASTLTEVLAWHAARHPDRPHVRLYDDTGDGEVITYGALAAGARRIAAALQSREFPPGHAVGIVLPTGRDYFEAFFGVLLAGGVPVPAYPPARLSRIEEHFDRLAGILENCQARAVITAPETQAAAGLLRRRLPDLAIVATPEELAADATAEPLIAAAAETDLALLQYTSGSTGSPKGVMLTHANLLTNVRGMIAAIKATPEDVFVSWLPLYHDMGLIGAWLGSLYLANPLVVLSPLQFLARPSRWLQAVHRYGGTISGGPNFGYELCLRRIRDEEMEGLDLSTWRYAFNGAEPVVAATLERFHERFARCAFRREALAPVYGLAENSVGVTFSPPGRGPVIDTVARDALQVQGRAEPADQGAPDTLQIAACGLPLSGHEVRVVDAGGRELPDRQEGRVEFRGPSSTRGYYRNAEATEGLFDGAWLDTGDRGYIAAGDLYITGRAKDLIIRAGRNIHPSDIESAIGDLEGVLSGRVAAFGSPDPASGTERLVVLVESRRREAAALDRLRGEINAVVADHLGEPADDVVLAPPNTIPRTSSGKIRRAGGREIFEQGRIGEGPERAWVQLLKLYAATLVPTARRALASLSAVLFAVRAWLLVGVLSPFFWIAALVIRGWSGAGWPWGSAPASSAASPASR